ncbi:NAD(P)/FAD-dependent oxidoreductase [Larsenimonas salina]|uniref:NAD(P)/FAD-dependent oxidoreductase n=1 Tax=Larsenimonas salina TaxID=1295565 RepID=UPI002073541F|nr:FAD-dependent oxidoreductase [Larsenimonas salina]MCM5704381.1 FAD-dependent oxidoreductase [Larsenimonas salina]
MKTQYDYLIVGAGMTAANAAKAIRKNRPSASIAILGEEQHPPVTRPALSKKLWTDPEFTEDDIWMITDDDRVEVHTETRITRLDRAARTVATEDGAEFGYSKLLLATGGAPKTLPDLPASDRVLYFRTYADYQRLRDAATPGARMLVAGGSYIGCELAAALVQQGCEVTLITPDGVLGEPLFPDAFARHFQDTFTEHGVSVITRRQVTGGSVGEQGVCVTLDDGSTLEGDMLAAGIGITPETALAEQAGLSVDDGIVVDQWLTTDDSNIFAAGDVARYPDVRLGAQRVEHVDNANQMGTQAGHNMAGVASAYTHTPYFYSNVFDLGFKAVGTADASNLDTVSDWQTPNRKGAIFYLDGDTLKGVMLIDLDDQLDAARALLEQPTITDRDALKGKLT